MRPIWSAITLLAVLPLPAAADPSPLGSYGTAPPPSLKGSAHGACKDIGKLRVAVDEWNAAHTSKADSKTVQDMCGCLETQLAKGNQAQFSKCSIPKKLRNTQVRTLANACACFDQLMGIQRTKTTTTVTTKPTTSSTKTTVSSTTKASTSSVRTSSTSSVSRVTTTCSTTRLVTYPTTSTTRPTSSPTTSTTRPASSSTTSTIRQATYPTTSTNRPASSSTTSTIRQATYPTTSTTRPASPSTSSLVRSATTSSTSQPVVVDSTGRPGTSISLSYSDSGKAPLSTPSTTSPTTSSTISSTGSSTVLSSSSQIGDVYIAGSSSTTTSSSGISSPTSESDSVPTSSSSSSSSASTTTTGLTATITDAAATSQISSSTQVSSTDSSSVTVSSDSATITDSSTGATTTIFPTVAVGTTSEFDGPYTLEPAPTATLMPAPPYGVDQGSLDVVTPAKSNALWYNSPANESAGITATIMRLTLTYQYASIALDQSIYIKSVTCSGSKITAVFNDTGVFSYAAPIWTSYSQVLFITAASSCSADGQNVFFLTSGSPVCDTTTKVCIATGTVEELADVFSEMDADWGAISVEDSTSTSTAPSTCSSPPASVISGLPAASCGDSFDAALDAALGYYSGDDTDIDSVMAQIAPGTQTALSKRGFWSSLKKAVSAVKAVVKAVAKAVVTAVVKVAAKVVTTAAKYVVAAAKTIASTALTIAKTAYNLVKFLVTGDYNQSFNLHMNVAPPTSLLAKSPWDDQLGFKFYHFAVDPKDSGYSLWDNALDLITDELGANAKSEPGVDFWCINCGIKGDIKATGSLSANLGGIKNAELQIQGNLYAGIFLGIDAFATIKQKNTKTLLKQGLPGLSIPKIFTLGPSVSLGVSAEARIELIGRALAGASLNWEKINGTINFLDKSKTFTNGFTPVLNGTLQTTKKSKLTLALGLPVAIEFGVDILDGKWKKEASLTETPSLQAVMDYEESVSITGTTENGGCSVVDTTPSTKCFGVYWNITAVNDVELALFDVLNYNLFHWESKVIAEGCVGKWADNSSKVDTCSSDDSTSTTKATTLSTQVSTAVATLATQMTTTTSTATTASCTSAHGLQWAYYAASETVSVDAIRTMTPAATGLAQNGVGNVYASEGYTLTSIDQSSVSLNPIWFIIDYVGYIYATTSGTYTFYASQVDDEFFMWWGSNAYSGWTRSNANLYQYLYNQDVTTSVYLTKGQYLPIRIMLKQVTGPGYWYFNLYDPNGQDLLSYYDTSAGQSAVFPYTCDGSAPAYKSWGSEP